MSLFTIKKLVTTAVSICLAVLMVLTSSIPFAAQAEEGYSAEETVRSHQELYLQPGAAITFEIKFKNTGSQTWKNDGSNFVSLVTNDPAKRKSAFQHPFWNEVFYRPTRLLENKVAPGEVGTFKFALQAPDVLGDYKEAFRAVAKDYAWIDGTEFVIPIHVVTELPKPTVNTQEVSDATPPQLEVDYPVRDVTYQAQWQNGQVQEISANPGEQQLITLTVKNIGTKTWVNTGDRFVSVYTVRPNYNDSAFFSNGPGWMSKSQLRISSDKVAPGEETTVKFLAQIPKTEGVQTLSLRLAVEDYSWMMDGEVQLKFKVGNIDEKPSTQEPSIPSAPATSSQTTIYKDLRYQATYLISSAQELILNPGENMDFQVGFKNSGSIAWSQSGGEFVSLYTADPDYRTSRFSNDGRNTGWLSDNQVKMSDAEIIPGRIAFFRFSLTAPSTPGVYVEKFRLAAEDQTWVKGGEFSLVVTVKSVNGTTPKNQRPQSLVIPPELGPLMKVGLFASNDPFVLTANSPFEVRSGNGQLLGSMAARSEVRVQYNGDTKMYSVNALGIDVVQSDYVIIQALDTDTITEIISLEKRVPWNPVQNENVFRGSVEIHHSDATNKTWAINVLPMEHYLRGIAETSSSSPVEFLKVMTVAARTYATYHYERQTKHANEYYYVDSEYDQVYRGYSLEQRHPGLTEAVQATAGQVVTYIDPTTNERKIAITPYFSQSDGRTRSWKEVWGGDVPWAQSVPVPQDSGKQLLGHGVGLSARGGLIMVADEGKTYDQVLNYFFKGITIEDRY